MGETIEYNFSGNSAMSITVDVSCVLENPEYVEMGFCLGTWSATGTNYAYTAISHSNSTAVTFMYAMMEDDISRWKFWSDDDPSFYFYLNLYRGDSGDEWQGDDEPESGDLIGEINLAINPQSQTDISCCRSAFTVIVDSTRKYVDESGDTLVELVAPSHLDCSYSINNGLDLYGYQYESGGTYWLYSGGSSEYSASTPVKDGEPWYSASTGQIAYRFTINNNCYFDTKTVDNAIYVTLNADTDIYTDLDHKQRTYDEMISAWTKSDYIVSGDNDSYAYTIVAPSTATSVTFSGVAMSKIYYCDDDGVGTVPTQRKYLDLLNEYSNFSTILGSLTTGEVTYEDIPADNTSAITYTVTLGLETNTTGEVKRNATEMHYAGNTNGGNSSAGLTFNVIQRSNGDAGGKISGEVKSGSTSAVTVIFNLSGVVTNNGNAGIDEPNGCSLTYSFWSMGANVVRTITLGNTPYSSGNPISFSAYCLPNDYINVNVNAVYKKANSLLGSEDWNILGQIENDNTIYESGFMYECPGDSTHQISDWEKTIIDRPMGFTKFIGKNSNRKRIITIDVLSGTTMQQQ